LSLAQVYVRPSARRELDREADYLEDDAGLEVALRFVNAAYDSFEALAQTPKMGAVCDFHKRATRLLRRWPVKGFENWLIFYLPKRDGVEIVHIIHGARDIENLLGKSAPRS
jgi:toxin ParE1/3/4